MITPELSSVLPKTEGLEASEVKLPVTAQTGLQTLDNDSVNFDETLLTQMHSLLDYGQADPGQEATAWQEDGKILPALPAGVSGEVEQNDLLTGVIQEIVADKNPSEMLAGGAAIVADASRSAPAMPLQNDSEIEIDSLMQDNKLARTAKGIFFGTEQQAFSIDAAGAAADARAKLSDLPNSGTQALLADKNTDFSLSGTSKTFSVELSTQASQTSQAKLSIGVPVQQARWADNLAGRVSYMLLNNQQSAQISLNPAELGPIEIRLSIQNDQANVNFYAHNATVRDAIEETFPRLREMLNENGLNLSQSSVSDQSLSEKQDESQIAKQESGTYPFMDDAAQAETEAVTSINLTVGLIDHFV